MGSQSMSSQRQIINQDLASYSLAQNVSLISVGSEHLIQPAKVYYAALLPNSLEKYP